MKIKSLRQQRGYLALLAVLLVIVIGFLGISIINMYVGSANTTNYFQQSETALFIAESGFEKAARFLLTPNLTGATARISCSALTGNSNLTNTAFDDGTFTATTVSGSPVYVQTTLSAAITSTATTITVASTSGFAPAGRIVIDREVINYGAISGNSFIGVQRGVNQNYNTPHTSTTPVSQYQCMVNVKGGVPSLTSPLYQREIQQAVQSQEAWAVGVNSGTNFVMTRWNRPTQIQWNSSLTANASATTLSSISMLSNAEGWAVGNVVGTKFTLLRWTGSSWALATSPTASGTCQNLRSVSSVYHQEAWAVGDTENTNNSCNAGGKRRYTVLKWNGTTWTTLVSPTIPADANTNANLNAVHVIDATQSGAGTLGFAVGVGGVILKYNGSTWVAMTSPTTNTLNSVYVVSATEAWAVGAAGTIIKWNGTSWSTVTSPTTTALNSINMQDSTLSGSADGGWAVGASGVAISYNGTSWSSHNTGQANNLNGVAMFFTSAKDDVWAVGDAGTIMHWNGSAWANVASGVTQQLLDISVIAPQQFPFAWQEIYP